MNEQTTIKTIDQSETTRRPAERSTRDWMVELANDLDQATRVALRLRPDGLVEVTVSGGVIGFIDHVAPVFVALSGPQTAAAVEVAQRRTLAAALDAVRSAAR